MYHQAPRTMGSSGDENIGGAGVFPSVTNDKGDFGDKSENTCLGSKSSPNIGVTRYNHIRLSHALYNT